MTDAVKEMETAVAKRETVKSLVAMPGYRQRFDDVLGRDKAAAFLGSLTALTAEKYLAACDPKSVLAAAFVAATLDLPIQKNLGFAFVVPYKGVGSFQIGWKGIVQLALRSGQYRRLNAFRVNAEALKGFDEFGEPVLDVSEIDDSKPGVAFVVAWELQNGFKKVVAWSREKCLAHAQRYSQSVRQGNSPWKTHEDEMCLKTVVKNALQTWGPMSVQMQAAAINDQSSRMELDAEPEYLDAEEVTDGNPGPNAVEKVLDKLKVKASPTPEPDPELDNLWDEAVALGEKLGRPTRACEDKANAAMREGAPALRSLVESLKELVKAEEAK